MIERGYRYSGQPVLGYIGPAGMDGSSPKLIAPLAKNDSEVDALNGTYSYRKPSIKTRQPVQRYLRETTIGQKKKIALGVILIFYAVFIISYTALAFFVLTMN